MATTTHACPYCERVRPTMDELHKKYGENLKKLFEASDHGRYLKEQGFEEDLAICAAVRPVMLWNPKT